MDDASLRASMVRKMLSRTEASGRIVLPAVPGMLEDYVTMCDDVFRGLGVNFRPDQLEHLRGVLQDQLASAFAQSPRSHIVITYDSPSGLTVNYHVAPQWSTVEEAYDAWVATRTPPLFGSEPDARVWTIATSVTDPATFPILDLGAGTGRNAVTLSRRGHPVDAVEMTASFAEAIRQDAARESLTLRVIERDIFTSSDDLRDDYQLILLAEVVSDFRTTDQLRATFELAARHLAPGGRLVFNAFVARDGYSPDDAARQLGQQLYTTIFTREDIATAAAGLLLDLESDDSVYEFEQANLPATAWPPTSWYAGWVSGQDVYDVQREDSPIDMRWLVYRKATV